MFGQALKPYTLDPESQARNRCMALGDEIGRQAYVEHACLSGPFQIPLKKNRLRNSMRKKRSAVDRAMTSGEGRAGRSP